MAPIVGTFGRAEAVILLIVWIALLELLGAGNATVVGVKAVVHRVHLGEEAIQFVVHGSQAIAVRISGADHGGRCTRAGL